MKEIYTQIWLLAKPYYLKGRSMDIDHIQWMMKDALLVCKEEQIDDSLLLPLVILHDVGYFGLDSQDPFSVLSKKEHMKKGAKIADEILQKVDYSQNKIKSITKYISVHDNWLLGDDTFFKNDLILGVFNDLDYMWMATPKGFSLFLKLIHKTPQEMIQFLETNEKLTRRPFCTKITKRLYEKYIAELKREFKLF
ncbi:MAG: hypothetical protein WC254_02950 [Candidatus Woesearchaeota archaeon]|jgi:hypothetical protein